MKRLKEGRDKNESLEKEKRAKIIRSWEGGLDWDSLHLLLRNFPLSYQTSLFYLYFHQGYTPVQWRYSVVHRQWEVYQKTEWYIPLPKVFHEKIECIYFSILSFQLKNAMQSSLTFLDPKET